MAGGRNRSPLRSPVKQSAKSTPARSAPVKQSLIDLAGEKFSPLHKKTNSAYISIKQVDSPGLSDARRVQSTPIMINVSTFSLSFAISILFTDIY